MEKSVSNMKQENSSEPQETSQVYLDGICSHILKSGLQEHMFDKEFRRELNKFLNKIDVDQYKEELPSKLNRLKFNGLTKARNYLKKKLGFSKDGVDIILLLFIRGVVVAEKYQLINKDRYMTGMNFTLNALDR